MITLGILFKAEGIVHREKAREPRFAGEDAMRILVSARVYWEPARDWLSSEIGGRSLTRPAPPRSSQSWGGSRR